MTKTFEKPKFRIKNFHFFKLQVLQDYRIQLSLHISHDKTYINPFVAFLNW